jgi:signal transduction histidine kinase
LHDNLARDLHDEVGPLLFAVDMTAAAIERLPSGRDTSIVAHTQSIHEASNSRTIAADRNDRIAGGN